MNFSSIEFLFYFLPLFLLVYYLLPGKNFLFLLFSLFFYVWGEGGYIILLLSLGLFNWYIAIFLNKSMGLYKRIGLLAAILVNLIGLFYFKYFVFILTSINLVTSKNLFPIPEVLLPIGISFFTFHAISYLVDVYRGNFPPEKNPINFLLYLSMFPQLIAGPIIRYGTVRAQIKSRELSLGKISIGIKFFIVGLSQKILIANTLAVPVDQIYALDTSFLNFGLAWLGAIGYTLQIYFDFNGYSNMAIGLALMVGIRFPENFNYPYAAKSVTEFWRRWHITLSAWFRDYVYIPLGGNQKGKIKTFINLLIVFILCGLWHGASWTFVVWGLYHGAFLIFERTIFGQTMRKLPEKIQHTYLLLVVILGWVIFRSDTLNGAIQIYRAMLGLGSGDGLRYHLSYYLQPDVIMAVIFGVIFSTAWIAGIVDRAASKRKFNQVFVGAFAIPILGCLLILSLSAISVGSYNPFIYYRF